ncbi:MAG: efflux RND transporter periplasmic adaptor subunit [Bacteroidales bacterium]|jgi:multidrug efflux pump subunit AcrA (membrane-fusion protein)|nr:efflux RND transporter periplasmic adaptor subunit [Bacteroidales bacterium]
MNWRKLFVNLGLIILVLGISYFTMQYLSSLKPTPESRPREEAKLFVRAQQVLYGSNWAVISATGRLSSQEEVDLSSEVQGQILPGRVALKSGTNFKEGNLLLRIFDEEAKNNLKASKSRFMNGIASILPDIRIDFPDSYDKYEAFFNSIEITKPLPDLPNLDSDKEKVFLASRNILNDYFSIKSAEVRLEKHKLYAPFDGTFTNVFMEVGSVANMGSRIASMIRTDKLELSVPVETQDIYWINIGDKVEVSTQDETHSWEGVVARKSGFVDPGTQSITVYVNLKPSTGNQLYQGQYLKATFSRINIENSFEIPRNAVFNKDKVFIVEDSILQIREIKVHKLTPTTVILSGLDTGDWVVTEPLINVSEGSFAEILK